MRFRSFCFQYGGGNWRGAEAGERRFQALFVIGRCIERGGEAARMRRPKAENERSSCEGLRSFQLVKKVFDKLVDGRASSPATATPTSFCKKSFRFPGAKTARKRFLLWKMRFSSAKIVPRPPYTPPGTIKSSRELRPSRALQGFFDSLRQMYICRPAEGAQYRRRYFSLSPSRYWRGVAPL